MSRLFQLPQRPLTIVDCLERILHMVLSNRENWSRTRDYVFRADEEGIVVCIRIFRPRVEGEV